MMRIASLAALFVASDAHRVSVVRESNSRSQFFESCDELQTMFGTRVDNIQAIQNSHAETAMNARTRARYTMRALGAVRILRRAKDCPWVVDGNAEDIQHVHSVAHTVLAENPCGEAALLALSAPAPEANQLEPLQHAVQILYSEHCEPVEETTFRTQIIDENNDEANSQMLTDAEEQAQDSVDDLMDAAVAEGESLAAGAFVQTEAGAGRVSRMLGAVFLSILYLLSCAAVGVLILGLIGFILMMFPCSLIIQGPDVMACFLLPVAGVFIGSATGVVSCGANLVRAQGNFSQLRPHAF